MSLLDSRIISKIAARAIAVIILLILSAMGLTFLLEKREEWKRDQEKQIEEQRRIYIEGK